MNGGESTATRSDADRRHRRRVWTVVAMLVLIPVIVFGSMAGWFVWQLDPPGKSGETVEVRFDPLDIAEVEIHFQGKPQGSARLVDPVVNAGLPPVKRSAAAEPEPTGINFVELLNQKKEEEE